MIDEITIGIPTHKRPNLLNRALDGILKEKLTNIKIVVSIDGIDETYEEYIKIEQKFSTNQIKFIYHKKNIGSLENFLYLRDNCETKYFMWLADDDEIYTETIKNLYLKLKNDPLACTAVPYWELLNEKKEKKLLKPCYFNQDSLFKRVFNYSIVSDDAFFYGLHKLDVLKKSSFSGYWWPNQKSLSNWCYVFQMDIILQGKVIFLDDPKYKWINHDYGHKYYTKSSTHIIFKYFAYFIRRINVYYFYLKKLLKNRNFFTFLIMIFVYPFLLIRDVVFREPAFHKVKFK
tara:strand:- start:278 stop:1144 length:867 start_codon:yes stop_codon:yes gene_type:complete